MITRQEALTSHEFHYEGGPTHGCRKEVGPRGGVTLKQVRARRNGMTQTWKTRPTEYSIPVKYGIRSRDQFRITDREAGLWHAAEACPLSLQDDGSLDACNRCGAWRMYHDPKHPDHDASDACVDFEENK